jgi:hypothetical protein
MSFNRQVEHSKSPNQSSSNYSIQEMRDDMEESFGSLDNSDKSNE